MPLPGSRTRRTAERVLRAAAALALALALWQAMRPSAPAGTEAATARDLAAALVRWTFTAPDTAVATFAGAPAPLVRDWLVALRRAGTVVHWNGRGLSPVAAAVERVPEPGGSIRVVVAAPSGTTTVLADAAGALGSVVTGRWGGSVSGIQASGVVTAIKDGSVASVSLPPALVLRRVLVLGAAGWESKFVVAALEERGWTVDARLQVAPGVTVTQGPSPDLDTARYAAVIALDTTAAGWAARISRYVLSGGGAVLAGDASGLRGLAALAPGAMGARVNGAPDAFTGDRPLRGLTLSPVVRLRADAVALGRRDAMVTLAARRAGAGRILQIGYGESWRWRMLGREDAAAAHRAWWSGAVSSVAYAPAAPVQDDVAPGALANGREPFLDAAPFAHLVAALGDAMPSTSDSRGRPAPWPLEWLFAGIALASLLGEWGSRRLRGVP